MEIPSGFDWPAAYTTLRDQGVFDGRPGDNDRYLWLNSMDWMDPDEMAEYEPHSHDLKNIVPFAHTAAYDVYAFWYEPGVAPCPVVMISDTELEYVFYAPSLEAAFLREILQYDSGGADFEPITPEGAAERRARFARIYGPRYDPHFDTLTDAHTRLRR